MKAPAAATASTPTTFARVMSAPLGGAVPLAAGADPLAAVDVFALAPMAAI